MSDDNFRFEWRESRDQREQVREYSNLAEYAEMRPSVDSKPSGLARGIIIGGMASLACWVVLGLIMWYWRRD